MPGSSSGSKTRKSSSASKKSSSASKRRSILKRSATRKASKRVRINSPQNQIREYSLGSDEKTWKKGSPSKRGPACGSGIFPCVYRGAVFENSADWNDHIENSRTRNASTGFRPIRSHRLITMSALSKKGKSARIIPPYRRVYNRDTGEVSDVEDSLFKYTTSLK